MDKFAKAKTRQKENWNIMKSVSTTDMSQRFVRLDKQIYCGLSLD